MGKKLFNNLCFGWNVGIGLIEAVSLRLVERNDFLFKSLATRSIKHFSNAAYYAREIGFFLPEDLAEMEKKLSNMLNLLNDIC